MIKSKDEILIQLKEEYPDVFNESGYISLQTMYTTMQSLDKIDESLPTRCVLVEKIGNINGRKRKLLKLFNQLSDYNIK